MIAFPLSSTLKLVLSIAIFLLVKLIVFPASKFNTSFAFKSTWSASIVNALPVLAFASNLACTIFPCAFAFKTICEFAWFASINAFLAVSSAVSGNEYSTLALIILGASKLISS